MQAVILAGGLGTRLRPLTDKIPKVMVKVRGREFLWYVISWLGRNEIEDIILCAGRLSEEMSTRLNSWAGSGIRLRLSVEDHPLGTAGAVKNAQPLLDEEFILLNGDTYLPIPYAQILPHWEKIKNEFDCLLVVYNNREKIAPNDTVLDDAGVVAAYSKRSAEGMQYVNAGLAVMKKSAFEKLPRGELQSLEEDVFPELIRRRKMAALVTSTRYYDIGTPERLKAFEEYVALHPEMLGGRI